MKKAFNLASFLKESAVYPVSAFSFLGRDAGYVLACSNGVELSRTLSRNIRRHELVRQLRNATSTGWTNTLNYAYDDAGRVTARNADTFGYNARSEVVSAIVASNEYAYAYDHIGNHTTASVNSDTTTYTANNLNQYTSFSNLVQSCNPVHDLDGNMLTNGVWSYTWDCENRLVTVSSNNVCAVSNAYDHASRRVLKVTPTATHTYVYDGWNLVQETISTASGTTTNHYIWGKDLSGTQGAGGVGGLLAVWMDETWYFPFYDNNGNITAYVNEQGVLVAKYTYDAFGGTIAASGSMSDTFRHRFSTKYYDTETGLYYYGYRFYNPVMHRWLNRDPIEEKGGFNLYAFCGNDGVNSVDSRGERITITTQNKADVTVINVNVTIQVVGCISPNDESLARQIVSALKKGWETKGVFNGRKYQLKFIGSTISIVSRDDKSKWDGNKHTFLLVDKSPSWDPVAKHWDRSHVDELGGSIAEIYSDKHKDWKTYVHEFGHMMGLKDRYYEETFMNPITGGWSARTTAHRGWENHIMGDGGPLVHPSELYQLATQPASAYNHGLPVAWR